jgi:hypothetical protein
MKKEISITKFKVSTECAAQEMGLKTTTPFMLSSPSWRKILNNE